MRVRNTSVTHFSCKPTHFSCFATVFSRFAIVFSRYADRRKKTVAKKLKCVDFGHRGAPELKNFVNYAKTNARKI